MISRHKLFKRNTVIIIEKISTGSQHNSYLHHQPFSIRPPLLLLQSSVGSIKVSHSSLDLGSTTVSTVSSSQIRSAWCLHLQYSCHHDQQIRHDCSSLHLQQVRFKDSFGDIFFYIQNSLSDRKVS